MENIDNLKSKSKQSKKIAKEKMFKLSEYIDDAECVEIDGDGEAVACIIDTAKTKVKSKMRK
jgi:hypothetical protein